MNQRYAGFGVRLAAALIDGIVLLLISQPVYYLYGIPFGPLVGRWMFISPGLDFYRPYSSSNVTIYFLIIVLAFLPALGVNIGYLVFYQKKYGQTIGKKAMNIKVVTYDEKTPTRSTFFIREIICKFFSTVIIGIGYLMVIWNPKKQALHDELAETYVVYLGGSDTEKSVIPKQELVPETTAPEKRLPNSS